jgi:hypothetical protein
MKLDTSFVRFVGAGGNFVEVEKVETVINKEC